MRRLGPRIEAWVRQHKGPAVGRVMETMDIAQNVALDVLRFLPRVKLADSDALERYLYRVIQNAVRDEGRRLVAMMRDVARRRPLPADSALNLDRPVDDIATPSEIASRREEEKWVRLALPLLSADDQSLFMRAKMLGEKIETLAEELGISLDAARMRVARSTAKLVRTIRLLKEGRLGEVVGAGAGDGPE